MTDERWIVIDRWDDFQHPDALRTGNIPWLKTFTRLLSDSSYLDLNAGERAVLHGIWLEYARARGQLTVDTASLTRRLSLRVTKQQLDALNHAGFIRFSASKPASTTASTLQAQTRREEKDLRAHTREGQIKTKTPNGYDAENPYVCPLPHCGVRHRSERRRLEHLENAHHLEGQDAVKALEAGRT